MKSYKDVLAEKEREKTRPAANSIHRSSLIFPVSPLSKAKPVVVLSNHFKIKRDIASVGMRVWGIDREGKRAFSDHLVLDEPRVYRYDLAARCKNVEDLACCQVEFFSGANLGMPYPAVMVNHVGLGFHNVVHSFARVLNDVFEAEEINSIKVAEASIDVRVDNQFDTFLCFMTGAQPITDHRVRLLLRLPGGESLEGTARVATTRYASTTIFLSEVFAEKTIPFGSVLRVETPTQPDYFGRMIGGILSRGDGAFSANHTYYDHGVVPEYVDAPHGYNYYPLFPGRSFRLVFYPIQAPSVLKVHAEYYDESGKSLGYGKPLTLESPRGDAAIVEVSAEAPSGARCFRIEVGPVGDSKLPSRLSHQVVIGGKGLAGSINESLVFPHEQAAPPPPGKPYLSWIQGAHGPDSVTQIGVSLLRDLKESARVDFAIYDEAGLFSERSVELPPRGATVLDSRALFGLPKETDRYFFVYAKCATSRIKMFSVIETLKSGHCSAEHNF